MNGKLKLLCMALVWALAGSVTEPALAAAETERSLSEQIGAAKEGPSGSSSTLLAAKKRKKRSKKRKSKKKSEPKKVAKPDEPAAAPLAQAEFRHQKAHGFALRHGLTNVFAAAPSSPTCPASARPRCA